ncbi:MAG: 4-hydroxythreonine-4-phosphate dehydrogenase PdxA [Bacteroidota bacterium]
MSKIKIGVTVGDINGVGIEVILKTFSDRRILEFCTPLIYGSSKIITYHKNIVNSDFQYSDVKSADHCKDGEINIFNFSDDTIDITLGRPTLESGKYAFDALEAATTDLTEQRIDAIVTAPINKEAMSLAKFGFPGHTEYLSNKFKNRSHLMLMVNDGLRIGVVTGHIPLSKVAERITKKRVLQKIKMMNHSLRVDFNIDRPTIAVLGLNPHASDNGVIGNDEDEMIRPAIIEAKKNGILAMGPYAADGFFGSGQYRKFDGILAMYHDQGLIPFKTLSFNSGVNYTAGLSIVRTSPDHGTAYDIVGKNEANPASFRKALFAAIEIAENRRDNVEMTENQLEKRSKNLKQVEERAEDLAEE